MQRVQGWCENAGQPVVVSNISSSTNVQASYPSCTVTVYTTNGASGLVSTSARSVTWLSGNVQLNPNGQWSGQSITINSVAYTIQSVSTTTTLTLTSSAGSHSSVLWSMSPSKSAIYSDSFGTPLPNPFTADSTGRYFFYVEDGYVDVQVSRRGISSPYTLGSVNANDAYYLLPETAATSRTNTDSLIDLKSAKDFGCKGISTDDSACFTKIHSYIVGKHPSPVSILFPSGTYLYNRGDWLHGAANVTIYAYGANFMMTSNGRHGFSVDNYALNFGGDIFSDAPFGSDFSPASTSNGYTIRTSAVGATSITTITASNAGNIPLGDVLIFGFDAQGAASYPPNPKYFEYNVVTAANPSTGVISLMYPLQNAYLSTWVDGSTQYNIACGAPRILSLNRTNMQIAQKLTIYGATFLAYSGGGTNAHTNGAINPSAGKNIVLVDVSAAGIYIGESAHVRVVGGTFQPDSAGNGGTETDKIISQIDWDGATIVNHTQATGALLTRFTNCTLKGTFQNRARNQVYEGNRFMTTASARVQAVVTSSYYVQSIQAHGNICPLGSGAKACFLGGLKTVLLPVSSSPVPTSASFTVPFSTGLANSLDVGVRLFTSNVAIPKLFIVSSFTCDSVTLHTCTIDGFAQDGVGAATGDVFTLFTVGIYNISDTMTSPIVGYPSTLTVYMKP